MTKEKASYLAFWFIVGFLLAWCASIGTGYCGTYSENDPEQDKIFDELDTCSILYPKYDDTCPTSNQAEYGECTYKRCQALLKALKKESSRQVHHTKKERKPV